MVRVSTRIRVIGTRYIFQGVRKAKKKIQEARHRNVVVIVIVVVFTLITTSKYVLGEIIQLW